MRLGQAEGAQDLAARQRLQPFLLLLGRAVGQQRRAVGRVVDAHHRRQPAVGRRDLLERQHVGHHVGARAAPFGRHRHAQEAEPAHLGEQRARDLAGGLPGADVRQHLLAREGAGGVADQGLFFSEEHGLLISLPDHPLPRLGGGAPVIGGGGGRPHGIVGTLQIMSSNRKEQPRRLPLRRRMTAPPPPPRL